MPDGPTPPGGGMRQRRAAEMRAEEKRRQAAERQDAQREEQHRVHPPDTDPTPQTIPDPTGQSPAEQIAGTETADEQPTEPVGTGPVGSGEYVVTENDCMSSIAERFGFTWERIWNDIQNEDLKRERENPMVLHPGDRVTIPEKQRKEESGATEMMHRFRRLGQPAKLRLRFLDEGEPRANVPCRIRIDMDWKEDNTDDDGLLEITIPRGATSGWVQVGEGDQAVRYDLELGRLEPHYTIKGVQQRLKNLGHYDGQVDGKAGPCTDEALSKFGSLHDISMDNTDREALYELIRDDHGS